MKVQLVNNSHPETAVVVAVVVRVDHQKQSPIGWRTECLLAADEERLRRSPIRRAYVADERPEGSIAHRQIARHRIVTMISFRRDGSSVARIKRAGRANRHAVALTQINAGVNVLSIRSYIDRPLPCLTSPRRKACRG